MSPPGSRSVAQRSRCWRRGRRGAGRPARASHGPFHKTPRDYHELNTASMAEHLALVSELGDGDWHKQEGALAWEQEPLGRAQLKETVERLGSWGYPVEIISAHNARKLEPDLQIAAHVDEVVFTPSEGYVDVVPLIGRLLAHAARRGA